MADQSEVTLRKDNVEVVVAPWRGGLVKSVRVGGTELLHQNDKAYSDPTKSIRSGIPLLFPFAGRLEGDLHRSTGRTIGQHGFARLKPWNVVLQSEDFLRLSLPLDAEILNSWPWLFTLEMEVRAIESGVRIDLLVSNQGTSPMPVAPGWHPYFPCAEDSKVDIRIADVAVPEGAIRPGVEFNFGIPVGTQGTVTMHLPNPKMTIVQRFSQNLQFLQFWSLSGNPYICVEPFLGEPNIINTDRAPRIQPGGTMAFHLEILLAG